MPATLNQLEQVEVLAVGVIHVLLGKAVPLFPTSTRAHPSFWVTVHLTTDGPIWPTAGKLFPFQVRWDIWETAVVPVLADESNQFLPNDGADKNWRTLALMDAKAYELLVGNIQRALVLSFQDLDLMQPEPTSLDVLAPAAPGEPVDRTPTVAEEDEMHVRFDTTGEPSLLIKFDVVL